MKTTLEALVRTGHQVTLVCPVVPQATERDAPPSPSGYCCEVVAVQVKRNSVPKAMALSILKRIPFPVAVHTHITIRKRVEDLLASRHFDVIHVEQVQAFQNVPSNSKSPIVVRCHNVESDIFRTYCENSNRRRLLKLAPGQYSEWEGKVVASASGTIALTTEDAQRLEELAQGKGRIFRVAVPFPSVLAPATEPFPGEPALVLLAGQGWLPQRDDIHWFLTEVWPLMALAIPGARLHVFGSAKRLPRVDNTFYSGCPDDSRCAFHPKAILLVPMRKSFGVRMKVLEAWARGTPVISTPQAVRGLAAVHEENLLMASHPEAMINAVKRLHRDPHLGMRLRIRGRETLRAHHNPTATTEELTRIYTSAGVGSREEHGD